MRLIKEYLFVISMILFSGCKNQKPKYIPLDAESKLFYSQKIGSQYVYKDSLTNVLDTFYVTLSHIGERHFFPQDCNACNHVVDDASLIMKSGSDSIALHDMRMAPKSLVLYIRQNNVLFTMADGRFNLGQSCNYNDGTTTVTNIYTSYTISGKTYPVVYETTRTNSSRMNYDGSNTYYNGEYGLVKVRFVKDGVLQYVYELQDAIILR